MALLLKIILNQPFIILGICFMLVGFVSIVFKVLNDIKTRNSYANRNRTTTSESKVQKWILAFLLLAILIAIVVFIWQVRK